MATVIITVTDKGGGRIESHINFQGDKLTQDTPAQYIAKLCHNSIMDGSIGKLSTDVEFQGFHGLAH